MKRYSHETRTGDRLRFEDNRGKIWDSDDLDEFASWEIEQMGLHVSEI
jgi:hypothetical protein